jgi:hypothetical protein
MPTDYSYKNIDAILVRMKQRHKLQEIAAIIGNSANNDVSSNTIISEQEPVRGLCFPRNPETGERIETPSDAVFVCDSNPEGVYKPNSYDPPCPSGPYQNCEQNKKVDCSNTTGDPFNCLFRSLFSCMGYECPTGKNFECKNDNTDFECAGVSFECKKDFKCTAMHVYLCNHKHSCPDKFECEGGIECNSPNTCNSQYPYGNPGGNTGLPGPFPDVFTNPGDFMCGFSMGTDSLAFTCKTDFSCQGKQGSDFVCTDGADFICGETGKGGTFKCDLKHEKTGDGFSCYKGEYACNGSVVACKAGGGTDHGCQFQDTVYATCPQSPKECQPSNSHNPSPPPCDPFLGHGAS